MLRHNQFPDGQRVLGGALAVLMAAGLAGASPTQRYEPGVRRDVAWPANDPELEASLRIGQRVMLPECGGWGGVAAPQPYVVRPDGETNRQVFVVIDGRRLPDCDEDGARTYSGASSESEPATLRGQPDGQVENGRFVLVQAWALGQLACNNGSTAAWLRIQNQEGYPEGVWVASVYAGYMYPGVLNELGVPQEVSPFAGTTQRGC